MKILHVESGKHLYGGALQVVFLMRGLKERGIESILACPTGSAIAEAGRPHATIREIPMRGDADIGMLWKLRRLIRQERPAIVHLHSRRGSDIWGGFAASLEKIPVVLSRRVDNAESRWMVSLKYRLYDRVVAISEGIRNVLLSEGLSPEKVVCVRSAVDTIKYHPGRENITWFRREFGLAEDEKTLAVVAQFIPRKGHSTLIEALPAILEKQPRTRTLLFGKGPEEDHIKQLVQQKGLEGRVVFGGFRNDLDKVIPCVDILVHPASMEGLGVALLQAAACEVPLIGGRAGGIPEIVRTGHTGELIEPGDVQALIKAALRLLESESLRKTYGQAGRKWIEEHFSITSMVSGNIAVYEQLLRKPSD
ncbi:MAG: glycosyltransferase [Puniceicoccales bacterium]|jgi:glycosyltransferase involved in cell wall biosynthesis|nr:glycosyltransferase [Puniceicoccales bacterium]